MYQRARDYVASAFTSNEKPVQVKPMPAVEEPIDEGRRKFLQYVGLGAIGAVLSAVPGCRTPVREMDAGTQAQYGAYEQKVMGSLDQFVNDVIAGFRQARNAPAPDVRWQNYQAQLGENSAEIVQTLDYLTETNKHSAAAVNGVDLVTNRMLVEIAGLKEELVKAHNLSQGEQRQIVEDFMQVLSKPQQDTLTATYNALSGLDVNLGRYHHHASAVEEIRRMANAMDDGKAKTDMQQLLQAYDANLASLHARLHAQVFLRASEGLYDDTFRKLMRLSDNIQRAQHGQSYTEGGAGVYDQQLRARLDTAVNNSVQHFKERDQNYLDDIMQDCRDPVALELNRRFIGKGIPEDQRITTDNLIGALYIMDQRLCDAAETKPESMSSVFDFLLRLLPGVALGDFALNQAGWLGTPDQVKGTYGTVIRKSAAAYGGFTNWENYVGNKDEVWSRAGMNLLITGVQAATFALAFSGGGNGHGGSNGGGGTQPGTGRIGGGEIQTPGTGPR